MQILHNHYKVYDKYIQIIEFKKINAWNRADNIDVNIVVHQQYNFLF
jgi:hypothetical protein